MTCNFDEMLLYEYVDKEISPADKVLVTNHLSACPHCRQKLAEIKLMYYELDHMDEVELPDEVEAIRLQLLDEVCTEDEKANVLVTGLKKTGEAIKSSALPMVTTTMKKTTKSLYKGTKKVYQSMPKGDKPPKKAKKRLGGLI